jgi:hypothetical protein
MTDLAKLTTRELYKDLEETDDDIANCQKAVDMGILEYGDGFSVAERLEANRDIAAIIEAELERRHAA